MQTATIAVPFPAGQKRIAIGASQVIAGSKELDKIEQTICKNLGVKATTFAARKEGKGAPIGQERPPLPERWGDVGAPIPRFQTKPEIEQFEHKVRFGYAYRKISAAGDEPETDTKALIRRARNHLDRYESGDESSLVSAARSLVAALEARMNPDAPETTNRMLRFRS